MDTSTDRSRLAVEASKQRLSRIRYILEASRTQIVSTTDVIELSKQLLKESSSARSTPAADI